MINMHNGFKRTFTLVLLLWATFAWPQAQPADTPLLRLGEKTRTFALNLMGGYLFIEGQVAGRSGGFMFDTGTPYLFMLNNAYLPLSLDDYQGAGTAGSAQGKAGRTQQVYIHENIGPVTVGEVVVENPGVLRSSNFGYITDMANGGIRPDLLGFAGLPLVQDAEFVIDYDAKTLTVHRLGQDGTALSPHDPSTEVVATLVFWNQKHMPFVKLDIGGVAIEGMLDTGVLGDLVLTPKSKKKLEAAHRLRKVGKHYVLAGLSYQGIPLRADTPSVTIGARDTMRLGFNFLRHYRTVWNYPKHTVTLLQPH